MRLILAAIAVVALVTAASACGKNEKRFCTTVNGNTICTCA